MAVCYRSDGWLVGVGGESKQAGAKQRQAGRWKGGRREEKRLAGSMAGCMSRNGETLVSIGWSAEVEMERPEAR